MNISDTSKRKWLALWIRCPEIPKTKGDILRYALYVYLKGNCYGLCKAIRYAMKHYNYKYDIIADSVSKIPEIFPLFNKRIAICLFNGRDWAFWWPYTDWESRYRYMKWLIKEYNKVEL